MESLTINILNPKALSLLKNLADLDLIEISQKENSNALVDLLKKTRKVKTNELTLDEITKEVEEVRGLRYAAK
jgi:hypothetical protein